MKTTRIPLLLAALACAVLAGCATPETRLRKHPEVITRLAPEQLDLIKAGQVKAGFDMDMVRLALGEPDQVKIRVQDAGSNEVWGYANYETKDGQPLFRGLYHRYYLAGDSAHPFYLNYSLRREHEHFHLVFKDDKLIAVEKDGDGPTLARLQSKETRNQ